MKLGALTLAAIAALSSVACGGAPSNDEALGTSRAAVVTCATGTTVQGVDVSTYDGTVDWTSVHASGRDFAIARVSDGTNYPDDTFATNWAGIKAAGMVRGVYQFFRASQDPTAQAELLISAVGTFEAGDLSPVADVEVLDGESGATLIANLTTWIGVIKAKTGRTPMIYASPGFWDTLPSTAPFASELAWVADWGVSCPDTSAPWTTWAFWQTADNGTVSGISDAVDLDLFNGTLAQLQTLGGPTPYAARFVSQSFPLATSTLTMTEGETIPSYIELENIGSKTWDSSTRIGTTQPRDRVSVFADGSWVSNDRPAAVSGTVAPGATYKFEFNLHAPDTVGTYSEYFGIVEENVAWFGDPGQGGPADDDLEVKIQVVAGTATTKDGGVEQDAGDDGGALAATPPGDDAGAVGAPEGAGGAGGAAAGGDGGSANAETTSAHASAGGCSVAAISADASAWEVVVALASVLAVYRRRTRLLLRQDACVSASLARNL
jgi:lysozyme